MPGALRFREVEPVTDASRDRRVLLSHGDGGSLTKDLIEEVFLPRLKSAELKGMDDSAFLPPLPAGQALFTTDSFVVDPMLFPGGDIGKLAACGTMNDLWVSGGKPLFLSAGFIIEEGTGLSELAAIVESMAAVSAAFGVKVVAGDTKVVPRGKGDKVFINTAGIGVLEEGRRMGRRCLPGDRVLVSGPVGEHGLVILATRIKVPLGDIRSDCGPVGPDVDRLFASGAQVHMMRDPTRGGLATVLKEVAERSGCDVLVKEELVPVRQKARELMDILGVDPLYLPCEGRVVAFAGPGGLPDGWVEIGLVSQGAGDLILETRYGGRRRLGLFQGTPLPRIC